ncbi:hypothetical protein JCM9492_16380 [Aquifex pyrophilus]
MLISLGYSLLFSGTVTYVVSKKFEQTLGKLYYVSLLINESRGNIEKEIIPIPIYEEMREILTNIEKTLIDLKRSCEKRIRELEEEHTEAIEKTAELIEIVEKLREGEFELNEIPAGLDPVGALGEALKESLEEIYNRIKRIAKLAEEIEEYLKNMEIYLEGEVDREGIKRNLEMVKTALVKMKTDLEFFK